MTAQDNEQLYTATVLASDLDNAELFEADRTAAYAEADPAVRRSMLVGMLGSATTKNGDVLFMEVLNQVTDAEQAATEAESHFDSVMDRAAGRVSSKSKVKPVATGYEFTLDGNGDVVDVFKKTVLEQSGPATKRAQETAQRIGYGPKQNDASFRTSPGNINPDH